MEMTRSSFARSFPREWVFYLALLTVGCGPELAPLPRHAVGNHGRNPDHEIFDLVLVDLINDPEFQPAVGGRGVRKSQTVLVDTTLGGRGERTGLYLAARKKTTPEVLADFFRRNPDEKCYSLTGYHPADRNIRVVSDGNVIKDLGFFDQFPDARGYVYVTLPGYSNDAQTAFIGYYFGPAPHGAGGHYLLKRVNGRWEIVWKQLAYLT